MINAAAVVGWNARAYDVVALPHDRWGRQVIGRLNLAGDETVMDLGCGTGRDVERLLDLLPSGRVIAVDGSAAMLGQLRVRLDGRLDQVDIVHADIRGPLPVDAVDSVMSVATLHWLPDHDAAFGNIACVLVPSGVLSAEAGGAGNVAGFLRAVAAVSGRPALGPRHFAGVDETVRRLRHAGFRDLDVELVADPLYLSEEVFEQFLATIMLVPELGEMPEAERAGFVHAVAKQMGEPIMDYVRLRVLATKA